MTLAINHTADDLIASYESAYDKEATIGFDREAMLGDFDFSDTTAREEMQEELGDFTGLTVEEVEDLAESEHIEDYYYTYSVGLDGGNIEKAEVETEGFGGMPEMFGGGNGGGGFQTSETDFTLTGYSSLAAMSEFIDGSYTMSELADDAWEKAFEGNYVFINEELASFNELTVGDTVKLQDEDGESYSFTIVGIFADNASGGGQPSLFSNSANTLITNAEAVRKVAEKSSDLQATVTPTFIIDDYANAEAIQTEFYARGLDENYIVETNEELANSGLTGVTNVKSFATTFLVITLVIGGVVLVVINLINIRERKYEIGVLRTIGISKARVSGQFVAELAMVALVALLGGAGIGALAAKPVSNALLASEISAAESSSTDMMANFGPGGEGGGFNLPDFDELTGNGVVAVSAYDSIDAVVDATVILELLGIGLALVLVSSLAAMVSVQRFSPLTILKERS